MSTVIWMDAWPSCSFTYTIDSPYDLRAKLDAGGFYDDFEVDRVVRVERST